MHVYSCHIQSQLVTRAVVRSGNFKNYSPRSLREINRTPGQTSRFIHASHRPPRFFPSTRPHFFPSLYAYFIIFFFPSFGLQPTQDSHFSNSSPAFQHLHARNPRIVSLSFNDIVDPSSRQPTCVRHWVKAKAKNLQGYFPLCFSPSSFRCSFSIDLNIDILFFLFVPFLRRGAKFLRVM